MNQSQCCACNGHAVCVHICDAKDCAITQREPFNPMSLALPGEVWRDVASGSPCAVSLNGTDPVAYEKIGDEWREVRATMACAVIMAKWALAERNRADHAIQERDKARAAHCAAQADAEIASRERYALRDPRDET